jgi:hypothetical protein
MHRKSSMDTGMQRQFSGSCGSIGLSRRASAAPPQALGTVAEAAEAAMVNPKLLGIVSVHWHCLCDLCVAHFGAVAASEYCMCFDRFVGVLLCCSNVQGSQQHAAAQCS